MANHDMRKATKLCTTALLAAAMLFTNISNYTTGNTAAEQTMHHDTALLYQEGEFPIHSDAAASLPNGSVQIYSLAEAYSATDAEQVIYQGLLNCDDSIDVENFQIPKAQLSTIYENVINASPELFYLASRYSYYTSADDNYVTRILPQYTTSGAELAAQKNFYNSQIAEIISQIHSAWSDYEKILFVHDYLASNYEYDNSLTIRNAYDFFAQKKGVCQAYTLVFTGIMKQLGIETSTASSNAMNHIWNLVKLNNQWYHVDVTWDDPVPDNPGSAYHSNLLLSDTAIAQPANSGSSHYNWTSQYTCTDTTYDNDAIRSARTPFQYLDGKWFYADFDASRTDSYLYSCNFHPFQNTTVYTLDKWTTGPNGYYTACFTGLASYNQKLYFNTASGIYSYDPVSSTASTVLTPDISGSIYAMRIQGQTLSYYTADSPMSALSEHTFVLEPPAVPEPPASDPPVITPEPAPSDSPQQPTEPILGDVDHSGRVDLSDAQIVLKAALKIINLSDSDRLLADVDHNNTIDLSDAQLILKYALKIIASF